MLKPLMLWFECASQASELELQVQCAEFFQIAHCVDLAGAAAEIRRLAPRVLCFDFDYPHQAQLRALQAIKQKHSELPTLMFTVEHSEALAVWAFRARVWNYLVKPVDASEFLGNLHALVAVVGERRRVGRTITVPPPAVPNQIPQRASSDLRSMLLPATYFVEQHFNERLAAEDVAQLCGMDRFRFSRLFRRVFGVTFQEYLLRYRVRQACTLLQRPRASVTDVGYSVGFNDASHFSRMFKRYMRMLPSEYAASCRTLKEDPQALPLEAAV